MAEETTLTSDQKLAMKVIADNIAKAKLLLSNLFARKQKRLIVDGNHPGVLYFTNIEHERISFYRTKPEDVMSRVQLSQEAMDVVYTVLPFFGKMVADIDIQKFCSNFNKAYSANKEKYPEIEIDEPMKTVYMLVPNKDDLSADPVKVNIGILLMAHEPEYYEEVIRNYQKFSDNVIRREFSATGLHGITDHVRLETVEFPGSSGPVSFGFPVKDGSTIVSFKEYVQKRKLVPNYLLELQYDPVGDTAKAMIKYMDDWVDAMTIMPGSLWFMSKFRV